MVSTPLFQHLAPPEEEVVDRLWLVVLEVLEVVEVTLLV
jgi:hypothetical protein